MTWTLRILTALAGGCLFGGMEWAIWTAPTVSPAGALVLTGLILFCVVLIAAIAEL